MPSELSRLGSPSAETWRSQTAARYQWSCQTASSLMNGDEALAEPILRTTKRWPSAGVRHRRLLRVCSGKPPWMHACRVRGRVYVKIASGLGVRANKSQIVGAVPQCDNMRYHVMTFDTLLVRRSPPRNRFDLARW